MHYPTFTITGCLCCKRQGLAFTHCTKTCKAFTCMKWRQSNIFSHNCTISSISVPQLWWFFCLTLWIIITLWDIAIAVTRGPAAHIHTHAHTWCRQSSTPSWFCVFWLTLLCIQQAARPAPEVPCIFPVMWSVTVPQWPSRLIGFDGRGKQL